MYIQQNRVAGPILALFVSMDDFQNYYMKVLKFITTVQGHFGLPSSHAGEYHQLPGPPCCLRRQNPGSVGDSYEAGRLDGLALVFLPQVA